MAIPSAKPKEELTNKMARFARRVCTTQRLPPSGQAGGNAHCPYKGTAQYWSVELDGEVHHDIVWGYRTPVAESMRVAGLVSFSDEKVDVYVDGELQQRPQTVFSRSRSEGDVDGPTQESHERHRSPAIVREVFQKVV